MECMYNIKFCKILYMCMYTHLNMYSNANICILYIHILEFDSLWLLTVVFSSRIFNVITNIFMCKMNVLTIYSIFYLFLSLTFYLFLLPVPFPHLFFQLTICCLFFIYYPIIMQYFMYNIFCLTKRVERNFLELTHSES